MASLKRSRRNNGQSPCYCVNKLPLLIMDTLTHCGEQRASGLHTLGKERAGKLKPSSHFASSLLTIATCARKVFPMSGGENDNLCRERHREASDTGKKYWDEQKNC